MFDHANRRARKLPKRTKLWNALRVGFFIAGRQVRANVGTSLLITLVMVLTYLNLLVVSGLMVGIVQGLDNERQATYSGNIILTNFAKDNAIPNSPDVEAYLKTIPSIASFSARYVVPARLESGYASKTNPNDNANFIDTNVAGINPPAENSTTGLSHLVVRGSYLQPNDYNQILVGSSLLARYQTLTAIPGSTPLPNVGVGSKIRLLVNGVMREMTIKGVVVSKIEELNLRAFVVAPELRSMLGRTDSGVNEIAIKLAPGANAAAVEAQLKHSMVAQYAKIQSAQESQPVFFKDFATTFNQLGSVLGGIGLVVAFIVMFILVFINIIMRRRSIGILQAIGIRASGIEIGYAIQSVLFALAGVAIGSFLLFMVIEPYFLLHPIDFPFSNGILSVSLPEALGKAFLLVVAIVLASVIPAHYIITRQEVVDAILGR